MTAAGTVRSEGAHGLAAKAAVDKGYADAVKGFRAEAFERDGDGRLVLVGEDGRRLAPVDEVIVLTGFRPDLSFLDELRLGLDERPRPHLPGHDRLRAGPLRRRRDRRRP